MKLPTGVFVPTFAFFKNTPTQEIDHELTAKHAVFLAKNGVAGLTVHGTTGEPMLLSRSERAAIIKTTKTALVEAGFPDLPVVVGCGVYSTWETIEICNEAASLGASYALIVAPGYYAGAMTDSVLEAYFTEVADNSKIPVILYNFPGISNGINLSLELISKLALHPNIVGIKLSCGSAEKSAALTSKFKPEQFGVYGGLASMISSGLSSGALGAVSGLGNITPRACVNVVKLFLEGKKEDALVAQNDLTAAGRIELQGGVPGMRYGMARYWAGYENSVCRRPLPIPTEELKAKVEAWISPIIAGEDGAKI